MSAASGMQPPMAGGDGGGLAARDARNAPDARKVGLWVFMAVVTSLFMLFSVAYVMRMATADWQPLRYIPWQLWLSTAVLALASAAWEAARRGAQQASADMAGMADAAGGAGVADAAGMAGMADAAGGAGLADAAGAASGAGGSSAVGGPGHAAAAAARRAGLVACALSLAFLAVQLWAWQAMTAMNFTVSGNPASSFFYLLTGLHGLHVCGGLVAAVLAGVSARRGKAAFATFATNAALCARYWHFLLLLWVGLFALLFLVTPDLVQVVCESVGIRPPQAR